MLSMLLEVVALVLGLVHFAVPLAYFVYLKSYATRAWNSRVDESYRPETTIIVPTYNEARTIEQRLEDIVRQDFPKEKLELILVDSASCDGTLDIAERWIKRHPRMNVKVIRENQRRGKVYALNNALSKVSERTQMVVVTDADCIWRKDALRNAAKYLADPTIGAVTCSIYPVRENGLGASFDKKYRDFNNMVRIAESKSWSTPIAHGPFVSYKRTCLAKLGGIQDKGADDSTPFTLIALNGYRSIQAPDIYVYEMVPRDLKSSLARRLRRAHHLISHFAKMAKRVGSTSSPFKRILGVEIYLHLVNPLLLLTAIILLVSGIVVDLTHALSLPSFWTLMLGGILFVVHRTFRTWILTQFLLIGGGISYLLKGELHIWEPIRTARE